jgi:Spy/CpxP family protein refolding chaperone
MHSHATPEVLDERKVSFVHIGGLPNKEDGAEDSFNEQDMVYYHKDDLTQYSKHLGLNKVKRKQQLYFYSDTDVDFPSDGSSRGTSARGRPYSVTEGIGVADFSKKKKRRGGKHPWDENYRAKRKKQKARKLTKKQQKRIKALEGIYGQDANQLGNLEVLRNIKAQMSERDSMFMQKAVKSPSPTKRRSMHDTIGSGNWSMRSKSPQKRRNKSEQVPMSAPSI